MNKQVEAAAIKKLEAEYCPSTERFDLEDWLAGQLFDTYHSLLRIGQSNLFRFRRAAVVYVEETELLNVTMIIGKDVVEKCILLSNFMKKNYGVNKLGNRADVEMELMLSEYDFELMAVQIVDELMEWYENMDLVSYVLEREPKQQEA